MAAERFFGKRIRRFEDPRLLAGKGAFLEDYRLPGMLHAAFVRSPYAHAEIRSVPVEAARDVPGVVGVFTAADIPGRNRFGVIPRFADQPALAEAETRFRGEAVALVAFDGPAGSLAGFPVAWTRLPDHADPAADLLHVLLLHGQAADGDRAPARRQDAVEVEHQGGLAGTVRAEQRHPLAAVHVQVDAEQGLVAVGVGVGQPLDVEHRRGHGGILPV